jgi:uncharacterized protein (DUF305 family)
LGHKGSGRSVDQGSEAVTRSSQLRVAALILAALSGASCVSAQSGSAPGARPATGAAPQARRANAADVEFMQGMIHHHAQAIQMSELSASHQAGQGIQTLSQRIIISQRDEIKLMQTWLRDNNEPAPEPNPNGMVMNVGGMEHVMLMPGMLSPEEMRALDQARGIQFDRLFLQGMIKHHEGALAMVEKLFASYGAAQDDLIYKFASDTFADQSSEIDRMQKTLAAMPGGE